VKQTSKSKVVPVYTTKVYFHSLTPSTRWR